MIPSVTTQPPARAASSQLLAEQPSTGDFHRDLDAALGASPVEGEQVSTTESPFATENKTSSESDTRDEDATSDTDLSVAVGQMNQAFPPSTRHAQPADGGSAPAGLESREDTAVAAQTVLQSGGEQITMLTGPTPSPQIPLESVVVPPASVGPSLVARGNSETIALPVPGEVPEAGGIPNPAMPPSGEQDTALARHASSQQISPEPVVAPIAKVGQSFIPTDPSRMIALPVEGGADFIGTGTSVPLLPSSDEQFTTLAGQTPSPTGSPQPESPETGVARSGFNGPSIVLAPEASANEPAPGEIAPGQHELPGVDTGNTDESVPRSDNSPGETESPRHGSTTQSESATSGDPVGTVNNVQVSSNAVQHGLISVADTNLAPEVQKTTTGNSAFGNENGLTHVERKNVKSETPNPTREALPTENDHGPVRAGNVKSGKTAGMPSGSQDGSANTFRVHQSENFGANTHALGEGVHTVDITLSDSGPEQISPAAARLPLRGERMMRSETPSIAGSPVGDLTAPTMGEAVRARGVPPEPAAPPAAEKSHGESSARGKGQQDQSNGSTTEHPVRAEERSVNHAAGPAVGATTADHDSVKLRHLPVEVRGPQLGSMIREEVAGGVDRITLRLTGENGETVNVRVVVRGDTVRATIVNHDEVQVGQMASRIDDLYKALDRKGFAEPYVLIRSTTVRAEQSAGSGSSNFRDGQRNAERDYQAHEHPDRRNRDRNQEKENRQ